MDTIKPYKYFTFNLRIPLKDKNAITLIESNFAFKSKRTDYKNKINYYNDCLIFGRVDKQLLKDEEIASIIEKYKISDYVLNECYNSIIGYSDGGSFNNFKDDTKPTFASSGSVIKYYHNLDDSIIYTESELYENASNNVGEIMGAINVLKEFNNINEANDNVIFILCSDSQYVIKGILEWLDGWIARGWKNNVGEPTPNRELWEEIIKLKKPLNIFYRWVRGHGKDDSNHTKYNNMCDELCTQEILKHRKKIGV